MAADSAVSIDRGRHGYKTYDTANKLFELVKGRPVGIMMYANAELNGVPWETIVKSYRQERETFSGAAISDYVNDFVSFLNEGSSFLFTEDSERLSFELLAYELLLSVAKPVIDDIASCLTSTGRPIKSRLSTLVNDSIAKLEERINAAEPGEWVLDPVRTKNLYHESAATLVGEIFENVPLAASQRKGLVNLLLLACTKDLQSRSDSGVVIAGFGSKDPFPVVHSLQIRGRLAGVTRISYDEQLVVHQGHPGDFRTFAQDESALQFITGVHGETRVEVVRFWREWREKSRVEMRELIARKHRRLAKKTVAAMVAIHDELTESAMNKFAEHMNAHQRKVFIEPFVQSIGLLPKDELAHLAESLVNLASMSQRFSVFESDTVGGPIDVVLISRGDGLVWIKRKHYFDLNLNPAWPFTHSGKAPDPARSEE